MSPREGGRKILSGEGSSSKNCVAVHSSKSVVECAGKQTFRNIEVLCEREAVLKA